MFLDEATAPGLLSIAVWTFERLSHLLTWRTCPGPGQGQEGRGGDTTVVEATGPSADQRVWPSHMGAPTADRQQWLPRPAHGLSPPGALGATYSPKTQQGLRVGLLEPSGDHRRSCDNHENRRTVTATPTQSCDRCRKMSFYRITANLVLFFLIIYSNWENSGKNKQRK